MSVPLVRRTTAICATWSPERVPAKDRNPPDEAIRGSSGSSTALDPAPMAQVDPKRAFRLRAWISRLDQDLPGGRWSDLNDWSQVSGVMVADHRPARASAIVAATNASFAFLYN